MPPKSDDVIYEQPLILISERCPEPFASQFQNQCVLSDCIFKARSVYKYKAMIQDCPRVKNRITFVKCDTSDSAQLWKAQQSGVNKHLLSFSSLVFNIDLYLKVSSLWA